MYLEGIIEASTLANSALATLRQHEVPATPDNYALWYEYHSGHSPNLRRTIDVLLSNGAVFDERTLRDLHGAFFTSEKEERTVRETSLRVQETLHEIIGLADGAGADARKFGSTLSDVSAGNIGKSIENLRELIEHLVRETQRMAGRSEYVGLRLRESADKVETLERNLEAALQDATRDGLTGVANRKCFDAAMRKLAGDAMNSGDDLALLMIDIDHFKNVNDTWGHPVGDAVLRYVAETLQRTVRGEDHVARYGGEEFAVILPHTDAGSAVAVSENIRRALAQVAIEVTPPMNPVTVSIGVSCYEPGDSISEWVTRCDAALYRAKSEGRDRVQSC